MLETQVEEAQYQNEILEGGLGIDGSVRDQLWAYANDGNWKIVIREKKVDRDGGDRMKEKGINRESPCRESGGCIT